MRIFVAIVIALVVGIALAAPARAQCGAKQSTCSGCHDGVKARAPSSAQWHRDHVFADVCAVCHGGDPAAREVAGAHAGLAAPLADVDAHCGSCHGGKSEELALRYRERSGARADDAGADAAAAPIERHGRAGPNAVAGAVALSLALFGLGFVALRERRT